VKTETQKEEAAAAAAAAVMEHYVRTP